MSPELAALLTLHNCLLYGSRVYHAGGKKQTIDEFREWARALESPEVDDMIGGADARGPNP